MTTITGTFTEAGVSSVLFVGRAAEEVDYSFTGAPGAHLALERSLTPSQLAWEIVAGPFQTAASGRYKPKANERLRWRIKAATAVTNGGFASDTGWTKGTGWTIGTSKASSDASQTADSVLSQTPAVALVPGRAYEITYTTERSAGTITPRIGGTLGTARSSAATFTETIIAGTTDGLIAFVADADFSGSVDTVVIAPNVTYSLADIDAIVEELRDPDGNVLETRTQAGRDIQGTLAVSGAATVGGALTVTGALVANGVPAAEALSVDPSQKMTFFEDFMAAELRAGLSSTAGSGTGNAAATTVAGAINGEATIKTASNDGTNAANASNLTLDQLNFKANQGGVVCEARVKISDVSEAMFFLGFTDTISTTVELPIFMNAADIDSDAADACGVLYDVDATVDRWTVGGVKNNTDTAPTIHASLAPEDDTYFIARVEVDTAGTVTAYINGTLIGSVANAVTVTVALTPTLVICNRSANQVTLTVDYLWAQQNR